MRNVNAHKPKGQYFSYYNIDFPFSIFQPSEANIKFNSSNEKFHIKENWTWDSLYKYWIILCKINSQITYDSEFCTFCIQHQEYFLKSWIVIFQLFKGWTHRIHIIIFKMFEKLLK